MELPDAPLQDVPKIDEENSEKISADHGEVKIKINEENAVKVEKCSFCGFAEDNERLYGKYLQKAGYNVHYFCMLFSSALNQRGRDERQGILGFLVEDVKKELRRGAKLKCCYCKKSGATIGCAVRKCGKKFHLPCGLQHETLNQYFGSFCVFCEDHRPKQDLPLNISDRLSFHGTANTICSICLCTIEARTSFQTLRAPCCKNSWFHRTCVQDQALNAGYFFKCPLCNNKDVYQMEMLTHGIYIPEQDASWEKDPDAFQDLLHRHDQCDLPTCICPDGRTYDAEGSRWEIILCGICGSQGCHISCGRLSFYKPQWECGFCRGILNSKKFTTQGKRPKRKAVDTARDRVSSSSSTTLISPSASPALASTSKPRKVMTANDRIVERIRSCQLKLQNSISASEVFCNSEDNSSNWKSDDDTNSSTSSAISLDDSIPLLEIRCSYKSDTDEEIDVVTCEDNPQLIRSDSRGDSDIDIVGDCNLRLSPTDFPSNENIPTQMLSSFENSVACKSTNDLVKEGKVAEAQQSIEASREGQSATKVVEPLDLSSKPQIKPYFIYAFDSAPETVSEFNARMQNAVAKSQNCPSVSKININRVPDSVTPIRKRKLSTMCEPHHISLVELVAVLNPENPAVELKEDRCTKLEAVAGTKAADVNNHLAISNNGDSHSRQLHCGDEEFGGLSDFLKDTKADWIYNNYLNHSLQVQGMGNTTISKSCSPSPMRSILKSTEQLEKLSNATLVNNIEEVHKSEPTIDNAEESEIVDFEYFSADPKINNTGIFNNGSTNKLSMTFSSPNRPSVTESQKNRCDNGYRFAATTRAAEVKQEPLAIHPNSFANSDGRECNFHRINKVYRDSFRVDEIQQKNCRVQIQPVEVLAEEPAEISAPNDLSIVDLGCVEVEVKSPCTDGTEYAGKTDNDISCIVLDQTVDENDNSVICLLDEEISTSGFKAEKDVPKPTIFCVDISKENEQDSNASQKRNKRKKKKKRDDSSERSKRKKAKHHHHHHHHDPEYKKNKKHKSKRRHHKSGNNCLTTLEFSGEKQTEELPSASEHNPLEMLATCAERQPKEPVSIFNHYLDYADMETEYLTKDLNPFVDYYLDSVEMADGNCNMSSYLPPAIHPTSYQIQCAHESDSDIDIVEL